MRVGDAYGTGKFGLSFELFPPKTPAGEQELFRHLVDLVAYEPSFITCTYGALGSTQAKTLEVVERVHREFACPVASHLTCVGSTVDTLRDVSARCGGTRRRECRGLARRSSPR